MAKITPKSTIEEIVRLVDEGMYLQDAIKIYGITRWTVWNAAKKYGLTIKKNWNEEFDLNQFKVIDTEEKAYWLGFIYADGYVGYNKGKLGIFELSLQLADIGHLKKFKSFMKWSGEIRTDHYRCRILIGSQEFANDLLQLGVHNRKSLTLKFPNLNQVPIPLRNHFIRGYFDGDGCIGKKPLIAEFAGTQEFLVSVRSHLKIPQLIYRSLQGSNNTYLLRVGATNAINLLDILYLNSSIYLDRKYCLYQQHKIAYSTRNSRVKGGKIGEVRHKLDNTERAIGEINKPIVFVEHSN